MLSCQSQIWSLVIIQPNVRLQGVGWGPHRWSGWPAGTWLGVTELEKQLHQYFPGTRNCGGSWNTKPDRAEDRENMRGGGKRERSGKIAWKGEREGWLGGRGSALRTRATMSMEKKKETREVNALRPFLSGSHSWHYWPLGPENAFLRLSGSL